MAQETWNVYAEYRDVPGWFLYIEHDNRKDAESAKWHAIHDGCRVRIYQEPTGYDQQEETLGKLNALYR